MSKNGYKVYIDKVLLPIAPTSIELTVNNKNETFVLANDVEINEVKKPGLTDIVLNDILLPQVKYPFATYEGEYKKADYYLKIFEDLKTNGKPFQLIIVRTLPNAKLLFDTNIKVSIEDYTFIDDVENGFDITVSINLKKYVDYATKTFKIEDTIDTQKPTIKPVPPPRPQSSSNKSVTIGCEIILNGRVHRDSYGSAPGKTFSNYRGKVNFVKTDGRSHPYHVTNPSGGWLGWVTKNSVQVI